MALDVGIFVYQGVPLELARAAASELEESYKDITGLRAHIEEFKEEDGKRAELKYKEWAPPVLKGYQKLALVDDCGRKELRDRKTKYTDELRSAYRDEHLGAFLAASDLQTINEEYDRKQKENLSEFFVDKEFEESFPGEYHGKIDNFETAIKHFNLPSEQVREIEKCIVFEPNSGKFVVVDLINYYKNINKTGIKIISECSAKKINELSKEKGYGISCALFPFIELARTVEKTYALYHCLARGLISYGNGICGNTNAYIGEAVYYWNKGEKQTATDLAVYSLIHELGGHNLGDLADLCTDTEYEKIWGVMRAPLNALTLQNEIAEQGRERRLSFTAEDKKKIAENIKKYLS